jgi:methionyl-tRNA synthetase
LQSAYKNFGEVPRPGELDDADRAAIAAVDGGFAAVGADIEQAHFRAALAEAMALAARVNQYVSAQAPWAALEADRARAGTILHVALRCIDSLKILFTPFLPYSSQALHELLGYEGWIAGSLEFREVEEGDGASHTVLSGDYASWLGRWEPSALPPGQRLREPAPLFAKLDPAAVVASELERMQQTEVS